MKKRKILVIMSNRWERLKKPHFLEVLCDEKGTVLKEKRLRAQPKAAAFDEVWENDEGKKDFAACHRFARKYGHKLQRAK
jgi:hypothetical protein